ncbi:hypothetical protein [Nannocystis punicea]|uniref:TIR domain-containing protein n=1 Tax=Nannocystis punicea TaxID=2995304 RepID=A0ABY7H2W1_9BACT|nr:hypothetical protein [Nannocystis poenicansa]WAS93600.1 hypothetical protein O0S08_46295 [Nannocystis poenicansa]
MQPAAAPPILFCYRKTDALDERQDYEKIHELLERAVRSSTGDRNLHIFAPHRDVRAGQTRRQTLLDAIDAAKVLIVVVEPLLLSDDETCELMTRFLQPERTERRLVPIYWMKCPEIDDEQRRERDVWGQKLWELQPVDWRMLRFQPPESTEFRSAVAALAEEIDDALAVIVPTQPTSLAPTAMTSVPTEPRGSSEMIAIAAAIRDQAARLACLAGGPSPALANEPATAPVASQATMDPVQVRGIRNALWDFFAERFSAGELREFLFRDPTTRGLCAELPEPISHAELCSGVIELLQTRLLTATFFARLANARSFFAEQISAIAGGWEQVAAQFTPESDGLEDESPHELLLDLLVEVFRDDTHRRSNWLSRGGELIAKMRRGNSSPRAYSLYAVQELAARELVTIDLFDDLWARLPHLGRQLRRLEELWPVPERRRATVELLLELFTSEFDLVTFVRLDPFGLQLAASLPGPSGLRNQARRFVELLEAFEPRMSTLFRRLMIHFPERCVAIDSVAVLWGLRVDDSRREAELVLWRDHLVRVILDRGDPSELWRHFALDSEEALFVPEGASDFASSCALLEELEALGATHGTVWSWLHAQSPGAAAQIGGLDRISATLQWVRQPSVGGTEGAGDTEHLRPFEEALARVLAILYRSRGELRWDLGEVRMWSEELARELPGEGAVFLRHTRAVVAGLSRSKLLDRRLLLHLGSRFRGRQALVRAVRELWVEGPSAQSEGRFDRTLQLAQLFASLFLREELRMFLRFDPVLEVLIPVLPEPPVRMRELALAVVQGLVERGLVGAALHAIAAEFPGLVDDARRMARTWEVEFGPA